VYLWHYPVLEKLSPHLLPHGELYTTLAVAALSAAIATASFLFVERPAQRLARRWIAGRRARAAASATASRAPA
jgi:peptidoglycan/LPS O-acetylase OafA/YrhL